MSRLYGSIDADASKTQATRRGFKHMNAHIRGWDSGIRVEAYVDQNGHDVFEVYRTGGSNDPMGYERIATLVDGFKFDGVPDYEQVTT